MQKPLRQRDWSQNVAEQKFSEVILPYDCAAKLVVLEDEVISGVAFNHEEKSSLFGDLF